jgi:NAD(P)H-dependent FMN reductase
MSKIIVLSSSVRNGKKSDRVALYFTNYITDHAIGDAELVDLDAFDFPIFKERLKFLKELPAGLQEFAEKIKMADGIIIISPEYNGGYPASLKNAIDVLYEEWRRKPIAIVTVSGGPFGGMNLITSLQFSLWKIGAWTVPAMFPVPNVEKTFDENGNASDKEGTDKRAGTFVAELNWCIEAGKKMA